jgi:predicted DsbA family dithiol-disulfide isomerase
LQDELDIELDWRGFELHPETPVGGIGIDRVFRRERIAGMREYMREFAAGFGVEMGFPSRMQNTRRALAVGEYARSLGKQDEFRGLAMRAYWRDGKDLENDEHLRGVADEAGVGADAVGIVDGDPRWLARIDEIRREASEMGVTGIPTFIFGRGSEELRAVVGCQPYASLLRAARDSANT